MWKLHKKVHKALSRRRLMCWNFPPTCDEILPLIKALPTIFFYLLRYRSVRLEKSYGEKCWTGIKLHHRLVSPFQPRRAIESPRSGLKHFSFITSTLLTSDKDEETKVLWNPSGSGQNEEILLLLFFIKCHSIGKVHA